MGSVHTGRHIAHRSYQVVPYAEGAEQGKDSGNPQSEKTELIVRIIRFPFFLIVGNKEVRLLRISFERFRVIPCGKLAYKGVFHKFDAYIIGNHRLHFGIGGNVPVAFLHIKNENHISFFPAFDHSAEKFIGIIADFHSLHGGLGDNSDTDIMFLFYRFQCVLYFRGRLAFHDIRPVMERRHLRRVRHHGQKEDGKEHR